MEADGPMVRNIVHLHIPAFPVAVERARRAKLREKPLIVGPTSSPRGRVVAASLEAYQAGIRRGMPLSKALKQCRGAVVVNPDQQLYSYVSRKIAEKLFSFSPVVEPNRYGHFFVDMSGTRRVFGHVVDSALRMRKVVTDDLNLCGTVGIARNKLVSSVAARIIQPGEYVCDVPAGSESQFLAPFDVRVLPSVKAVEETLVQDLNVRLVRELASIRLAHLSRLFGPDGDLLYKEARGIDESPVRPPRREPSVIVENTLAEDTNDDGVLLMVLYRLTERAAERLRQRGVFPRAVALYLRYSDRFDGTGTASVDSRSNLDSVLFRSVEDLFFKVCSRRQRVHYVSVEFTRLTQVKRQMSLFGRGGSDKGEQVSKAVQLIRERFGSLAINPGRLF